MLYIIMYVALVVITIYYSQDVRKIKRYIRVCKQYSEDNYYQAIMIYEILSTLITALGIPFAYVDLFAAYIYPFPYNILLLLSSKTFGSAICFLITRIFMSEERKKGFLSYSIINGVNEVITQKPIFYGTLV